MATIFEVIAAAEKRMEASAVLAESLKQPELAEEIRETIKQMKQRKLIAVVAGEVKRGKSLLLNMLLEETNSVCPVDAGVCTNAVTILSYGEQEEIHVYLADADASNGVRTEAINRADIPNYVSEKHNPNNFKNVIQIHAALPNPRLKDGVVFVDTPGVGSLNPAHAEITYGYLPEADVLLFVSDAITPMTDTEIAFLKRAYHYCKTVIFPLTKADMAANYDTIMNGNRDKISSALEIPPEDVCIVPVSSTAKLEYLTDTDLDEEWRREYLENSNYEALEQQIWTAIAKRQAEVRVLPYVAATEAALTHVKNVLSIRLAALENPESASALKEELESSQEKLRTFQNESAGWRKDLSDWFKKLRNEIEYLQGNIRRTAQDTITNTVKKRGYDICKESEYMNLLGIVNHQIASGRIDIRSFIANELSAQVNETYEKMEVSLAIDLNILDDFKNTSAGNFEIELEENSFFEKTVVYGKEVQKVYLPITLACTVVGAITGAVVEGTGGTIAGGPVGTVLGFIDGVKNGAALGGAAGAGIGSLLSGIKAIPGTKKYNESDVQEVREKMTAYLNEEMALFTLNLKNVLTSLERSVFDSFDKELKARQKVLQDTIDSIKESMHADAAERLKLKKQLQEEIEKLQKMTEVLIQLEQKIQGLSISGTKTTKPKTAAPASQPAAKKGKEEIVYNFL